MLISGLQRTTLLDYPGHVAATIFTGGCNFRCPFCHNSDLLQASCIPKEQIFALEDIFTFLKKRKPLLEGVCITGGEPTLQPDLETFIRQVRELGYLIKLDTNGSRPEVLARLLNEGLLDYVAMDIKSCRPRYSALTDVPVSLEAIAESIDLLKKSSIPYEFRTTVVRELHTAEDFLQIGQWLSGPSLYYLQNYQDSEHVLKRGFSSYKKEELEQFRQLLLPYLPNTYLRGVD
ncbi:MAG: anaerobic ribonucleoside-triphosphate reductase activating protein [Lachnospiraceae bacterium]|nr:anaerobic ribonucleoside-triphosphate reductase activating protein [Lachnospiraceae bacterium]